MRGWDFWAVVCSGPDLRCFGVPRVWEQLQQVILAKFGGREAFDTALAANSEVIAHKVQTALGPDRCEFHRTRSDSLPLPLTEWWDTLGIPLVEGLGKTEAISLIISRDGARRLGSLCKAAPGADIKITE